MLCAPQFIAPAPAMITPGCSLCFGSLEFIADRNGEFGLRTTVAPFQAIRIGSLEFIADDAGGLHRVADEEVTAPDIDTPLTSLGYPP
jgi:hypothetical protein